MGAHTKGPWEHESGGDFHTIRMDTALEYRGAQECQHRIEYNHGCFLHGDEGENRQWQEAEANARLIASAPDLLEAATLALEDLYLKADKDEEAEQWTSVKALRAAIRKATGEAS